MKTEGWLFQMLVQALITGVILVVFAEYVKVSFQKQQIAFVEQLKWETKVKEQAARVAEYLALVTFLQETSSETDFRRANHLALELAMWLPADVYKAARDAVVSPTYEKSIEAALAVRKLLLGENAGELTKLDIPLHRPGIGRKKSGQE